MNTTHNVSPLKRALDETYADLIAVICREAADLDASISNDDLPQDPMLAYKMGYGTAIHDLRAKLLGL
ncbi:MAG: hypothetical protein MN733_05220 [Nitrososphaera sp.]|nr:hypothetical protein [Nitrososphaera sp.]